MMAIGDSKGRRDGKEEGTDDLTLIDQGKSVKS